MKLYLLTILIFVSSLSVIAQTQKEIKIKIKHFENANSFLIQYDKSKDQTQIDFNGLSLSNIYGKAVLPNTVSFGLTFSYKGQVPPETIDVFHIIIRTTVLHKAAVQWQFLRTRHLEFLLDAENLDLGEGVHGGKMMKTDVGTFANEFVVYEIKRPELERIADSTSAKFQVGSFAADFNREHKQMIKDMLILGSKAIK